MLIILLKMRIKEYNFRESIGIIKNKLRTKPDWGFVLLIGKARYLLLFYWNIYVGFDICILLTIVLSGLFDFSIVYEGRISIFNRILCCFGTFFSIIHIVFPLFLKLYFRIDLYRYHHCL